MKRSLPIVLTTSLVLLGCSAESPRAVAPGHESPLPPPSAALPGNVASLASAAPIAPTTSAASPTPVSAESPSAAPKLSTPTNELTVQLLHQLRDEPGNVVFSGSSLRTVLATAVLVAPSVASDAMLRVLQLDTWTRGQTDDELFVTMPKFSFAWGRAVQHELEAIGALDMHTPTDVFHNAFVLVDEAGTEAAAATAVTMHPSLPPRPLEFEVDHQFLFFIRNQLTVDLLFAGRVVDPEAQGLK